MSDKKHTVSESADKIVVKTKVKRGSGTRDQDTINIKVKGDKATEVVEKLNNTVELIQHTATDLREMQPGESE